MGEYAGRYPERAQQVWWLRALNAALVVAVVAFVTFVVGEVVYALEEQRNDAHVHDHGFYGRVFESAWVVFVPAFVLALVAGVVALAGGAIAHRPAVTRYGTRAVAFCALAVAVVALLEVLGS